MLPPPSASPLQPSTRQLLLMCSCPAERLRLLLELLQRLDRLCCSACGRQLATTAEVLAMTTEGIGGTYVNSHGCVCATIFACVRQFLAAGPAVMALSRDGNIMVGWSLVDCRQAPVNPTTSMLEASAVLTFACGLLRP